MSELIVMLTHNDVTVKDAQEVFESCADLPVKYWGFKDHGLEPAAMKKLVDIPLADAQKVAEEAIDKLGWSYTEEECMRGAKLGVECGFDYLLGTLYFDSVYEYVKTTDMKYCPFVGRVSQTPSILEGTVEEMLAQEADFAAKGIYGTDLLGYRYTGENVNEFCKEFVAKAKHPVCLAGSIGSDERVAIVKEMNPWTFTMGSALFAKKFVKDGTFRENLEYVIGLL